jgi:hypothetical protein
MNFFFRILVWFFSIFPPYTPAYKNRKKKVLPIPEVCFLDATQFVRLVLTGVKIANFFNTS